MSPTLPGRNVRIIGTILIAVGFLALLIDADAARAAGAVLAIVGVGLRIEAAIADSRPGNGAP